MPATPCPHTSSVSLLALLYLQAMIDCDSPWLVNLMATLQDNKNIYMLMEVVLGGELFAYLQVGMKFQGVCWWG